MEQSSENPFEGSYLSYYNLVQSGKEQPQSTHADRYELNYAYGISAYSKGAIFLSQLGYVVGQEMLMDILRRYYQNFKFRHPTPTDFIRVAEKVSGMQLGWYLTEWTKTTNTIDYGIKAVSDTDSGAQITLERIGLMPMPIDVLLVYKDGNRETLYLPLQMMRGEKDNPYGDIHREVLPDWPWAQPQYVITLNSPVSALQAIVIDPSQLMADVNLENNLWRAAAE
jgi:aminopeptidase N